MKSATLNNAQIADKLLALGQLLAASGGNEFKARAYRRAAEMLRTLPESVAQVVANNGDLTQYPGIGKGISAAIQEILRSGTTTTIESLRPKVDPVLLELNDYPRLNPKIVLGAYKKLKISSIAELKRKLESGELAAVAGDRITSGIRTALFGTNKVILSEAQSMSEAVCDFLMAKCGASRAEVMGDVRRCVETIEELVVLVEVNDFTGTVERFAQFGGRTDILSKDEQRATFRLPVGLPITLVLARVKKWGAASLILTGSTAHLGELKRKAIGVETLFVSRGAGAVLTEKIAYKKLGLPYIPPELREGHGEVEEARKKGEPDLVTLKDLRGELHAHSTSSDGADSLEAMAAAAQKLNYEYLGITDHSQSLKIAGGVTEEALWAQLKVIDKLNTRLSGFKLLKSAEVDILADGSLDYPDDLLKELDYTVCSIHSRFKLGKAEQTERIMRAMDSPYFTILGHATGRLLLRRAGYEIDFERILEHARSRSCFFEINASPDRLDLSAENARLAVSAGVKIAICTDAHRSQEFAFVRHGIEQARRARLRKEDVLNTLPWPQLKKALSRGK